MDDKKIIHLIQTNPNKGIHMAMQMYGGAVNTICRAVLKDLTDGLVDEAVSDTFFKLWKNVGQFKCEQGKTLKSWIYSIARNTAIDIRRKNGYPLDSLDDENVQEPRSNILVETEVQNKELKQILYSAIADLGEPDNSVFVLKYFFCMKNRDIADKLNISEKKTENILYRGKTKLKEILIERGITCYED